MSYIVGQVVGVLRTGSWGTVTQGKYVVTKVNKVRVELQRIGDGHARQFSVKTGNELGNFNSVSPWIVSEGRYDEVVAGKTLEQSRQKTVGEIKAFAAGLHHRGVGRDDLTILRALIDEAEKFAIIA